MKKKLNNLLSAAKKHAILLLTVVAAFTMFSAHIVTEKLKGQQEYLVIKYLNTPEGEMRVPFGVAFNVRSEGALVCFDQKERDNSVSTVCSNGANFVLVKKRQ